MKRVAFFVVPVALFFAVNGVFAQAAQPKGTPKRAASRMKAVAVEPDKAALPPHDAVPQSPVAINNMANMYFNGQGVKQDYQKALYLYRKAADEGHTASMIAVGYLYEQGLGTKVDYAAAMQWYRQAADMGYAGAQKAIGDLYRLGRGVKQDDAVAAQWYQKAADQNFAEAQCRLGYMMIRGRGAPQDRLKAKALLEEGAAQDNACSQHYLGFMYMHGMIGRLPDTKKALELDKMAAGNGNAEAQYNMGKANEIGWVEHASEAQALNWYRHSASRGYPPAMERLATVYEKGELTEKADPETAGMWREKARLAWAAWPFPRPDAIEKIRFMPPKE